MRKMLALATLLVVSLAGCPEPISAPAPRPKPPQGALNPARLPPAPPGGIDVLTLRRPTEPEWFGLYLVGKKAGWSRSQLSRERRDGQDVLVGRAENFIRATVGGKTVERRQTEERVYEARAGGRLLTFRAAWAGDGGDRTLEGTCGTQGCKGVYRNADGTTQEKDIAGPVETVEQADGVRLAAARRATVRGPQLDIDKLRVKDSQDVFVRRERVAGAGVETEVSVIAESEAGDRLASEYKVADDGRVVEIRLGDAIVARPESEAVAKRLDQVDLFALSRVQLPRGLPRSVPASIVFRVQGLPAMFQKPDARQSFARGPAGEVVLTVRARAPAAADPRRDPPRARAAVGASRDDLEATPQVDWQDPRIQALAKQVAGDVPGTYAAATKLADHVFHRLEKAYGASADRATEVLVQGKGDCTEHALLFVALARALGIPARGVHGLVYAEYGDKVPALYWHAWAEVKVGGEWVDIDPTFGQPVADATHVQLGQGTQVDTVGLLGALKVTAVDVREGEPAARAR